jgi:hypothetical protein
VFVAAIRHNGLLLIAVPLMLFLALVLGVLLFEGVRGWRFYRSVLFMPYIIAIPVVGIVFSYIFQLNGILNTLLRAVGLKILAADWLGSPRFALGRSWWWSGRSSVRGAVPGLMSVEEAVRGRRSGPAGCRCCSTSPSPTGHGD